MFADNFTFQGRDGSMKQLPDLIFVATIVQFAPRLECWGGVGSLWSLLPPRICREAGARVTTNIFVRDLGPRSSHRRCPSLGSCRRWFAAPQWSAARHRHHAGVDVEVQRRTKTPDGRFRRCWRLRGVRRRGPIQSWWHHAAVHSWWSLLARSQEGGPGKPSHACPSWRKAKFCDQPRLFATTRRVSMEDALVRHTLLRSGQGVRHFSPWSEARGF